VVPILRASYAVALSTAVALVLTALELNDRLASAGLIAAKIRSSSGAPESWTKGYSDYIHTITCGQVTVPPGTVGNFWVLAGSTVTSTGATVVIGNLGGYPGPAVTRFPPGSVTGSIENAPD
jgi:hypothetical protein